MPKENPILYTAAMITAILDGSKTETRRIMKGKSPNSIFHPGEWADSYVLDPGNESWRQKDNRYGNAGDLLWVREAFVEDPNCDHESWNENFLSFYQWDNSKTDKLKNLPNALRSPAHVMYAQNHPNIIDMTWRPSIHMPRWACRIELENSSVHWERLHAITEAGAIAEGIKSIAVDGIPGYQDYSGQLSFFSNEAQPEHHVSAAVQSYKSLWNSINGENAWDRNDWVQVIKFKVKKVFKK